MFERIQKSFLPYFSDQKETLGLLNYRRNKYLKQRSHHSIFELLRKEGW